MADQANEKRTKSRKTYYLYDDDITFIERLARARSGKLDMDVSRGDIVTEAIALLREKEEGKKTKNKPINRTRRK